MKRTVATLWLLALFCVPVPLSATAVRQGDNELYERAKLAMFDKKWDLALVELDRLIRDFPDSGNFSQALFYRAKCLEEQRQLKPALDAYHRFLKTSANENLAEEAQVAIIDIGFTLFQNGEKPFLQKIIDFLAHPRKTVRYYAAFKLSYAVDKTAAGKAVPVLKQIVADEKDNELQDRARIALMRINPDLLKKEPAASPQGDRGRTMLRIRIINKKDKHDRADISFPFVLAQLALEALSEDDRRLLKKKGYDLDRILRSLNEGLEIMTFEDEESLIKIWLE